MDNNTPCYYVNSTKFAFSVNDMQMILCSKDNIDAFEFAQKGEEYFGDILAKIIMSPQHAKAFSKVLKEQIESYEAAFGEIILDQKIPDVKIGK